MKKNSPYLKTTSVLTKEDYHPLIDLALKEDHIENDVTTHAIFASPAPATAILLAKEDGILCGSMVFTDVFLSVDNSLNIEWAFAEGSQVKPNLQVAKITGNIRSILTAERTALNFLSMLSGIASKTARAVTTLKPYGIFPLDTRKTIPGFRKLSKYAVFVGGGLNHRIDLEQMGLIKDNHIAAAGSISKAVAFFRQKNPALPCEVEVENPVQLQEALSAKADMILLDNMNAEQLSSCVQQIKSHNEKNSAHVTSEASGGFNLANLEKLKGTGVDFVSMGSLTNNIDPLDFSLEIKAL